MTNAKNVAAITYSEAKEKFLGMPLFEVLPEYTCGEPPYGYECDSDCATCTYRMERKLQLGVERVFSTRRSFLLDTARFTFVVPKKSAAGFELLPAELSSGLLEQIDNLGLKIEEPKFIFCRTWTARTRRYLAGEYDRTFVYPCEREKATCLMLATRGTEWGYSGIKTEEVYGGKCEDIQSYSEEDGRCGSDTIDFWRFQYDPMDDKLVIPEDELDQSIDRMVELMEAEAAL